MDMILKFVRQRYWLVSVLAWLYWAGLQVRTTLAFLALAYLAGFAFYFGLVTALDIDMVLFDRANLVRVFHIDNLSGVDDGDQ